MIYNKTTIKNKGDKKMNNEQLEAMLNGVIGLCQMEGLLSTNAEELADQLQTAASGEMYISKQELLEWV